MFSESVMGNELAQQLNTLQTRVNRFADETQRLADDLYESYQTAPTSSETMRMRSEMRMSLSNETSFINDFKQALYPVAVSYRDYLRRANPRLSDPRARELREMELFVAAVDQYENLVNTVNENFTRDNNLDFLRVNDSILTTTREQINNNANHITRLLQASNLNRTAGQNATPTARTEEQEDVNLDQAPVQGPVNEPEKPVEDTTVNNDNSEDLSQNNISQEPKSTVDTPVDTPSVPNNAASMADPMTRYFNEGGRVNDRGWYFNPWVDEFDPDFNPMFDPQYGGKTKEQYAKEALEKYHNDGFGQNAFGWYFNPWIDEFDPDYDPTKDPEYNPSLKPDFGKKKDEPTKESPEGPSTPSDGSVEHNPNDPVPGTPTDEPAPAPTEPTPDGESVEHNPNDPVPGTPTDEPVAPEPIVEEPEPIIEEPVQRTYQKPLEKIIAELTADLTRLNDKDYRRLTASNLRVGRNFANKMRTGTYLYKIVGFPMAVVSAGMQIINKIVAKVTLRRSHKEELDILQERLNNLSEQELETLYREYKGSEIIRLNQPSSVNHLIVERIKNYAYDKYITPLKEEAMALYNKLFDDFSMLSDVSAQLNTPGLSPDEYNRLRSKRAEILSGKAEEIARYREVRVELNNQLSGGVLGLEKDFEASNSKMNRVGARFAAKRVVNDQLNREEGELKDMEAHAIAENDDAKAFAAFMSREKLLSDNTYTRKTIFGIVSRGEREYNPLLFELNYQNDPFVRDLFASLAVVGATINVVDALKNSANLKDQIAAQQNAYQDQMNKLTGQVNEYGRKLGENNEAIIQGQQQQLIQNEVLRNTVQERYNLDASNWKFNSAYRQLDDAAHAATNQAYADTVASLENISERLSTGNLTQVGAMEELANQITASQSSIVDLANEYLPVLRDYAASHPQFDLASLESGLQTISSNASAISNMATVNTEMAKIAEALSTMNIAGSIPTIQTVSSFWPALLHAGTSAALAANVANRMCKKYNLSSANLAEYFGDLSQEDIENIITNDGGGRSLR